MRKVALIVAGGIGTRMKSDIPKQFLKLKGKPVLMHTIERFLLFDSEIKIRLVLPEEQFKFWYGLCKQYGFGSEFELISGGENRYNSVKNGLKNLPENILIAVHDGVRPLVSLKTINQTFNAAKEHGAAIPVIGLEETLREVSGSGTSFTVSREKYKIVQTPQIFKSELLFEAYRQPYNDFFTDDASIVENLGHKITLTEGTKENIKITTPLDLILAETIISSENYYSSDSL